MSLRRALLVGLAALVVVTLLDAVGALDPIELPARDAALRALPRRAAAATAIVAIDERSLKTAGPWPWPRPLLATLVNRIADAGARGVVLDVLLAEPRDGDAELVRALQRLPAVMVAAVDERGEWILPAPSLRGAATIAHGNFELDHDGILRRLSSTKQSRDVARSAVCYEAAAILRPIAVPVGRAFAPAFRTAPSAVPVASAVDPLPPLHGKIAFVGPTAMALGDRVLTPVSGRLPDPGVTVHAAATESLLRGEEVREVPPLAAGALAGAMVLVLLLPSPRAAGRGWRAAPGEGTRTGDTPHPAFGHLLPAARGEGRWGRALLVLTMTLLAGLAALEFGVALPLATLLLTFLITTAALAIAQSRRAARDSTLRLAEWREQEAESKRVLAHELKTPLASMRGLTQLLAGFELSEAERRRVTNLLETEAGKLETMVQGLLELERLSLREFDASASPVDLGALVANRIAFLQVSTERELRVAAAPPLLVRGDSALLERIVDNLVGNALKYTDKGVSVSVRPEAGEAMLEVDDEGSGISDADRERIFQRFFRGATAAGTHGLGLGLSFVAEIAKWHGGRVEVEASPGGGSRFRVTFPLAAAYVSAGAM